MGQLIPAVIQLWNIYQMKSIYRFTSFDSLVDLTQSDKITLVNHHLWEDPYEGFLFKVIHHKESEVLDILKKISSHNYMPFFIALKTMSNCLFGQSWTKCEESDALWRIYSYDNKAIRVEVKIENISKLEKVTQNEIVYSDFEDLEEEIKSIVDSSKSNAIHLGKVLLRKRKAFKHEEEVRLLSHIDLNCLPDNKTPESRSLMNQALSHFKKKGAISQKDFESGWENNNKNRQLQKVKDIDFSHIPNFIESIMVHPFAPTHYVNTVKQYCEINKLPFTGKSKLYTLQV